MKRVPISIGVLVLLLGGAPGCHRRTTESDRVAESYIRLNLLGYFAGDQKLAIIGSRSNLAGQECEVVEADDTEEVVYAGPILPTRGNSNTPFEYSLPFDFSDLVVEGRYRLRLEDGTLSHSFVVGAKEEYREALATVLEFFRSQRCGDTDPILHQPCHLNDAKGALDASGGWHDAGDYIKYVITVGFTSVQLLTTADYAEAYGFSKALADDSPENGIPDLLEEARVGLDWILKMTSDHGNGNYYYQVSGAEDHDHWRLPETDDETGVAGNPRSLHKGWGGNILGKSAAALAIAARVFEKYDRQYAARCLDRAEALFSDRHDYESSQPAMPPEYYDEADWRDDMVLGAAELFLTTGKDEYKQYAEVNLDRLEGDDIDWKQSDFLAFAACFRAGVKTDVSRRRMLQALNVRQARSEADPFFLSSEYVWGTTALFTGDAQKALMYSSLTGDDDFAGLAISQRDYLLGRNNWGVSFLVGVGPVYPENAHSQLNDLAGLHRGAAVGGPAARDHWEETMTNKFAYPTGEVDNDRFRPFQSDVVYFDDQADYYTNEVALDYTSASVFVLLYNLGAGLSDATPVSPAKP
jgi:hypothetical protein